MFCRPNSHTVLTDSETRPYLTLQEFSEQNQIPMATLRRWKRNRTIPHFQPAGKNGRILIPSNALELISESNSKTDQSDTACNVDDGADTGGIRKALPGKTPAWIKN